MGTYTFVDILISSVLALIMFGIGLSLRLNSFRRLFILPRPVVIGLLAQMIALPSIAFLFCFFSDMPPELQVGLMILSVCPGGTTSNFITYLLNGNTALSVSLTTFNSVLTLFSIPFIVNFSLEYFMGSGTLLHLPYLQSLLQIFAVTIMPATVGVYVRQKYPLFSARLNRPLRLPLQILASVKFTLLKSTTILMLAVVFGIKLLAGESAGGAGLIQEDFETILPVGLLFNVTGLMFGYFFSRLSGLRHDDPMTIGVEVGLQNTTLAFLVAGTLLQNVEMQKPALVYAFFSFWTALIFGFVVKKVSKTNL